MSGQSGSGFTPPAKKGRKSAVGDTHVCGSCEVWVQLGSSATYRERHSGTEMRHPGNERNASSFSSYLSRGSSRAFDLRPDSCLCKACFADCLRRRPGEIPRWQKQLQFHCAVCHQQSSETCTCGEVKNWSGVSDVPQCPQLVWKRFFGLEQDIHLDSPICEEHFQMMKTYLGCQQCKICDPGDWDKN